MDFSLDWTKLVAAFVILIIGIIVARLSSKFIKRLLEEIELDKLIKKTGFFIPFGRYFYLSIRYLIYFGTIVLALRELGISNRELEIVFIMVFVLIVVFIILAFKDILPNLFAKFAFLGKYDLKKGDKVRIDSIEGIIEDVGLLEIKIKTKKEMVFIPNHALSKKIIIKK